MLIQILPRYEKPTIKNFKSNGKDMTIFEQTAYMHKGGAFPEPFKIGHQNAADCLPVGDYNIAPSSFVTDNFGGLALSKYDTTFVPVLDDGKKL
jgi:hypothetical protein